MAILDDYLKANELTRYQVAKSGHIAATTLQNAITREYPVDRISVKIIIAIAEILNKTPGTILDEMLEMENELNTFNEGRHFELEVTIQRSDNPISNFFKYNSLNEACTGFTDRLKANNISLKTSYILSMSYNGQSSTLMNVTINEHIPTNIEVVSANELPELFYNMLLRVANKKNIIENL